MVQFLICLHYKIVYFFGVRCIFIWKYIIMNIDIFDNEWKLKILILWIKYFIKLLNGTKFVNEHNAIKVSKFSSLISVF